MHFLDELEEELDEIGAVNKDEIIERYKKRMRLGLEAGMSEKEICKRFKKPRDIAKEEGIVLVNDDNKSPKNEKVESVDKRIVIDLVGDDVEIEFTDDDKFVVENDTKNPENYEFINNSSLFSYKDTKRIRIGFFKRKQSAKILIKIPKAHYSDATIKLMAGDLKMGFLDASHVELSVTSTDGVISGINSNVFKLKIVSGDFDFDFVKSSDMSLSTVSGDVNIKKSIISNAEISSVSGDVKIIDNEGDNLKASSVSGVVEVNGVNISKGIKGYFSL